MWANTQTQLPALYSAIPDPHVTRRFDQDDPVARDAAQILERALSFSVDSGDTDDFMVFGNRCVLDYLLVGRPVARVDYKAVRRPVERRVDLTSDFDDTSGELVVRRDGEAVSGFQRDDRGPFILDIDEEVIWEEADHEYVDWRYFRVDPDADRWEDVKWIAFGDNFLDQKELREQFGRKAKDVPLNFDKEVVEDGTEKPKRAQVWEIWNKRDRTVYAHVKGHDKILKAKKDPLRLQGFFPCPSPPYIAGTNDSLVPVPEFTLYQDQAEEINVITARIAKIVSAVKAVGIYAGEEHEVINQLLDQPDNKLIPVPDYRAIADKGGLKGIIEWVPIDDLAKVLQVLLREREVLVQAIFELTGIADIQRGATDPRETARAQNLKAQFGSRRLLPKQQDIQRFFRDLYRLKAEIMAEHFSPDTFAAITGKPPSEEAIQLLRQDGTRNFNIDIETDATVAPDEEREKQGLAEFLTALQGAIGTFGPLVQQGVIPPQAILQILRWFMRKFKISREIEEMLEEQIKNAPQQAQPQQDPEAQAKAKAIQDEMQLRVQEVMEEQKRENAELQQELRLALEEFRAEQSREDEESGTDVEISRRESGADIRRKDAESAEKVRAARAAASADQERKADESKAKIAAQRTAAKSAGSTDSKSSQ